MMAMLMTMIMYDNDNEEDDIFGHKDDGHNV